MKFFFIILLWAAIGYFTVTLQDSQEIRLRLIGIAITACILLAVTISIPEAIISIISFAVGIFTAALMTVNKDN